MDLMLVDDHPLFMEGLQYLLETHGIEVVGIANNGREALEKARRLKPSIILMDIKMPEFDGLDALRLIKAEMPDIKVIMLTTSNEDEDLLKAIKFGASGYLLKNTHAKELISMLSDVENGEIPFSTGLAAQLLKEFKDKNAGEPLAQPLAGDNEPEQLSARQLEILEMIAQGVPYKDVGEALGLSERTVKYHMKRIIETLHLENRAQVISYAARMGITVNTKSDE